jgi:hypothetical protein
MFAQWKQESGHKVDWSKINPPPAEKVCVRDFSIMPVEKEMNAAHTRGCGGIIGLGRVNGWSKSARRPQRSD